MKKKIMIFIILIFSLFLTSCGLKNSSNSKAEITEYQNINTGISDSVLQTATFKVEGANVLLSIKSTKKEGFLKFSTQYKIQSAVLYKKDGNTYYAITSYEDEDSQALEYKIIFKTDTSNSETASLVGYDTTNDIAIYKFTSYNDYQTVIIPQTYTSCNGDMVFSIASYKMSVGSYSEYDFERNAYNLYNGIIEHSSELLIKHEAMASTNNAGSALYDYDGNFIGLNVYKMASTASTTGASNAEDLDDFNFAVRCDALNTIISQIEANGIVSRPGVAGLYLEYNYVEGVEVQPYYEYNSNGTINKAFSFPEDTKHGIYVFSKGVNNSFRDMMSCDFITEVNGRQITSVDMFKTIMSLSISTDIITITAYRNGFKTTYKNKSL